ncbi:hypothetical protein WA158_005912 [Blastocystis sp. Blastoise]
MVEEKAGFDDDKMVDIQKDVIHFERLIGDLIGESINELVKQSVRNCEGMDDKNGDDPSIIIQGSSYIHECDTTMNNNDNGIDYIRFTSSGLAYSLPKRITNSLIGSLLYEYSQENQRTVDGDMFLDYRGDDTVAPLLIDSLMNKKINIDILDLNDQFSLLNLFEYCCLPIPEELTKTYYRRDHNLKLYKEDDAVILYINDKKDDTLRDYWKENGLWNKIINRYNNGSVDYDEKKNEMFMKKDYQYINQIHDYIQYNCIYISEEEMNNMNKQLLENEMCRLFGDKVINIVDECIIPYSYFPYTRILTNKSMEIPLMNWLGKEKKWKLLFRASEHDYKASEFHKYCDNQGETVTIIKHLGKNNHINIFGGYTDQSWAGSDWKPYSKEFLFTLSNEHGIPPTQYDYNYKTNNKAIYCYSSYGPTFGMGYDIYISNQCHSNTNSYCKASCYSEVNTHQYSSLFVNTSNTNSKNIFTVEDYEVWGRA